MDSVLTTMVTSVSDFRSDMPGTLARSKKQPFAVLSNNKPSFYVVSPELFEQFSELLFDLEIAKKVEQRIESAKTNSITVDLEDL